MRTFMLGARTAFAQLCKRARRIIVMKPSDKKLLAERHKYPEKQVVLMEEDDTERVDWPKRVAELMQLYKEVATEGTKKKEKKKQRVKEKA